jgi:hypothetical protein
VQSQITHSRVAKNAQFKSAQKAHRKSGVTSQQIETALSKHSRGDTWTAGASAGVWPKMMLSRAALTEVKSTGSNPFTL